MILYLSSIATMRSVRLVLCFFLLTAVSGLFKEDECTHLQKNLEEISDKEFEEVDKRKKFSITIITGKSVRKKAGEYHYTGSKDTEYCADKTTEEIMILIISSLFIGITEIHKHTINYAGNIMKKCMKKMLSQKGKSDHVEGINKKRKKPSKENKKSSKSVEGQAYVALENNLDVQEEEKLEVLEEKKSEELASLQKSSRKETLFTSSSAKCMYCKISGGTDNALKKCRGCR